MEKLNIFVLDVLDIVINAILQSQKQVTWKSGKAYPHLLKRISLGHLPENATI